ncbi:MAG: hypothetical protein ABI193_13265, partial [Minicystis sp.]
MARASLLVSMVLVLTASACGAAPPPIVPAPGPRAARPRTRAPIRTGLYARGPRSAEDKQLDPEARRFLLAHLAEPAVVAS